MSSTSAGDQTPPASARLIVLAGPTAVGKGTVVAEVRRRHPQVWVSLSATTRPPRPDERDGVDYLFVDDATFDEMVATGALLEWAVVHGRARYGTPRHAVEARLVAGESVLLEIDVQGARQVRASMPDACLVFLAPPSWDELVRRLVERGTESVADRDRRLVTARAELGAEAEFDVSIVTADVRQAADELVALWDHPWDRPSPTPAPPDVSEA